ncbi:unnamed protein product [Euphydryas editha]|uniref:UV radiation resistance-associated gene protein n=1 Tax=Euphydryas editha TaxID=104508 RepID=A0AAU9UKX9_EUPED|nr:unnamed protein product [Euphydryas editha]
MFGRPRCREWTPLTTQQLRLRSLIQIVGYNIRPPEGCTYQCSYYLTLHHTTMSAPFYTSERICSPHPKWKEIDSEITQRMSSTNVVIRIWCHILATPSKDEEEKREVQDTVIETWGVYFSGLRYIGANLALNFTSDCFKSNTLVFQMHGGYFCSYKSLKLDIIPPENELEQGSLSSDSSGKTKISNIILESRLKQSHKIVGESRSLSPGKISRRSDKEYSKSHSPIERGFKQNFPTMRSSSSSNMSVNQRENRRDGSGDRKNVDPNHIYEHSPDNVDVREFTTSDLNCDKSASQEELSNKVDLSETAESYDLRNESDGVPKYRYLALSFLKSEIRPSYNATKLQSLHLLQYSIKKRQEAVQEIKERIYKKSALNESWSSDFELKAKGKSKLQRSLFSPDETEELNKEKSSSQTDLTVKNGRIKDEKTPISNCPRLTLKLNDLLSYKSKPSPFQRAEHVRLTKQLEILHFKRLLLSDERDSKLANIRRLKERHAKLFEENQDIGSELMQNYHTLSRRTESLKETRESCYEIRELAARSHAALGSYRCNLLLHLHKIFYIQQQDSNWSICDVPLPICGDENRATNPVSDSVAAGFVAQATVLTAAILNQPLRYKITLLGSASKILDITPDLPDPNIPLFARGGDVTLFRYAMFLLNKCIAQLLWGRGLSVHDMRPTLANLQRLLTTPSNLTDTSKLFGTYRWLADSLCPRTQSLRSLVPSERGKYRQFNRFKETVDSHTPQKPQNLRRHKHSRSVGSYHEDQELSLNDSTISIMGSESNIYNMKLAKSECSQSLKPHNSDSEIAKLTDTENKVQFTLGDDTDAVTEQLVRMSTNNDDSVCIGENVKRICSEITDFCSNSDDKSYNVKEIDIAKYMERKSSVEIEDISCDTCENNKDGVCDIACANNVRDVIVIPSAEAILEDPTLEEEQNVKIKN